MGSRHSGFTLIELLVVIAIIGILAAIALPQFSSYRKNGFDSRAQSDLRNMATAEEAYFAQHQIYKDCTQANCATVLGNGGFTSDGVLLSMTGTTSGFSGTARHPAGSGVVFNWNSQNGGLGGL